MAYEQPKEGAAVIMEKGGKVAPEGLWRHPESGQEAITQHDPLFGNAMSQGFQRLGFRFIRPAQPGEIVSLPELAAKQRETEVEGFKGLAARLELLEEGKDKLVAENEALKQQLDEYNKLKESKKESK